MMKRTTYGFMLASLAAASVATAASAEAWSDSGLYGVARVGGSITPKQELSGGDFSAAFPKDAKYKVGPVGELGVGYDFGRFRLEQTLGYASNDLKSRDLQSKGFDGDGRVHSLNLTIAGYVDIPITDRFAPYVGGGVGVAQVDAKASGFSIATTDFTEIDGKKWGLLWHVGAGMNYRLTERTTLEAGVRYTEISNLKYEAATTAFNTSYKPKLSTVSALAGVRYAF
jgi:opacity protein-like surface antigen